MTASVIGESYTGIGFGALFLVAAVWALKSASSERTARYYLTTFRVVETKGGSIVKQVYRSIFRGRPLNQFLQGPTPQSGSNLDPLAEFPAKVLDPSSGKVMFDLGVLPRDLIIDLKSMASLSYCKYCGRKNEGAGSRCSGCGANL